MKAHAPAEADVAPTKPRLQYAALPFREGERLEIMLISSRETRRWVVPKGWPIKGAKPHFVAAIEAMEEAGLLGKISKKPIGAYHYVKRLRNGAGLLCEVRVFPFRVARQRKNWPERSQRTTKWFDAFEAAELVHEPGLQGLIRGFAGVAADEEEAEVTPDGVGR